MLEFMDFHHQPLVYYHPSTPARLTLSSVEVQDALLQRSFAAEPIVAVAASPDGTHVAGGGVSGHLYLWQSSSGRLLRTWPAHYKVHLSSLYPYTFGHTMFTIKVYGRERLVNSKFSERGAGYQQILQERSE